MKKLLLIAVAVLMYLPLLAQTPQSFSYQAVVRNANNELIVNQRISVRISILVAAENGDPVYVENHYAQTNNNGLFSISVGAGTPEVSDFNRIDWGSAIHYLKTEIDTRGGSSFNITTVQQLLSVPYSLFAQKADSVNHLPAEQDPLFSSWNKDYYDLTNRPEIPQIPDSVSAFVNDAGYLTEFSESDPNVSDWAKQPQKPRYSYNEIDSVPALSTVALTGNYSDLSNRPEIPQMPDSISAFVNDAGYLTESSESDPNVSDWAKQPQKPRYSYNEIDSVPALSTVALTGDYSDLTNRPEIPQVPDSVSAFVNDAGYLTEYNEIQTLSDVIANGNSANGYQIKNVANPTDSHDVVTLSYFDSELTNLAAKVGESFYETSEKTIRLNSANLISTPVLSDGWAVVDGGYYHSSGINPLVIPISASSNSAILVTFNASGVNQNVGLNIALDGREPIDVYNGTAAFAIGFIYSDGNISIIPSDNYQGTITNLKVRLISEDGTETYTYYARNVYHSGEDDISGFWNVAVGPKGFTLNNNENGTRNIAIGYSSLTALKSGHRNICIGTFSGSGLVDGNMNVGIGADVLYGVRQSTKCVAIGENTLCGNPATPDIRSNECVAIGHNAMGMNSHMNKTNCIAIGENSGWALHNNGIAIGKSAGVQDNDSQLENVIAIGHGAKANKNGQTVIGGTESKECVLVGTSLVSRAIVNGNITDRKIVFGYASNESINVASTAGVALNIATMEHSKGSFELTNLVNTTGSNAIAITWYEAGSTTPHYAGANLVDGLIWSNPLADKIKLSIVGDRVLNDGQISFNLHYGDHVITWE